MWFPYWIFILPYFGISALFCFLDTQTNFRKYRTRYCELNIIKEQYTSVLSLVLFNLLLIKPILIYYSTKYIVIRYTEFNLLEFCYQILFFTFWFEITFYFSHRGLHNRKLFPYIHHLHHELRHTIAICGVYCHPFEFVLGNFIPPAIGPLFLKEIHYYTLCIWTIGIVLYVTLSHCGYGGSHIEHHWFYHKYYGITGLLDYALGTNRLGVNKE